jgi:glutathione S-transferase
MALTVYGSPLSPFVARVALAATAKGMKYSLEMPKDGIKTPDFLAMNPFGKIPVLKDGKTVLYESAVIVEYLEAKGKTKRLVPKGAKAAASVRLIAAVAGEYVQAAGLKLFRHWRSKSTDDKALEDAKAELAKYLDVFEKVIDKGKYAAGSKFSLADVYAIPALFFAVHAGAQVGVENALGGRKRLKKYWAAIQKDKTAKAVVQAMSDRLKTLLSGT